jgi:hypothetical protein
VRNSSAQRESSTRRGTRPRSGRPSVSRSSSDDGSHPSVCRTDHAHRSTVPDSAVGDGVLVVPDARSGTFGAFMPRTRRLWSARESGRDEGALVRGR